MAGRLDDDAERQARRITAEDIKDVNRATLHTAALVLLERGRVQEAAGLAVRLHALERAQHEETMDDEWLLRGRLLSVLGFSAQSQAAFAQMREDDPGFRDLIRRFQSAAREDEPGR